MRYTIFARGVSTATAFATAFATALIGFSAHAAEPPSAPAPGSPGVFIDHSIVAKKIAEGMKAGQDPVIAAMSVTDQYVINEARRGKVGPPAVHPGWTEVHIILEGSATFVTGGKITNSSDGKPAGIEGGVSQKVKKGDTVVVPANTPHWYQHIDGEVSAIEVRFVAPTK
jgi:mannose-6-phosphate isomerase-like protein (cupin superfamily)